MTLMEKLQNSALYTEREQKICEYILEHCEQVSRMSSRELGRQTLTSSTVIIRFCRKLGYESYNDFKINLISDLKLGEASLQTANLNLEKHENSISVINKIAELEKSVIEVTRSRMSVEIIEKVCRKIDQVKYVDIIAVDANVCIGDYASHMFFHEGKISNTYSCYNKQLYLALNGASDHVVFLISRSGEFKKILEAAAEFKKAGIFTVAITGKTDSTLARLCDISLEAIYHRDMEHLGNLVFHTSAKYIFDTITSMLLSENFDSVKKLMDTYGFLYHSHNSGIG
ncbi:MAG: MurR/RpiR family transcriptional regulator [Lachnospiraceae bacterium]|nr:MurR/RpiR family transcriptional regulator [Lachnospiraceae bacterium]